MLAASHIQIVLSNSALAVEIIQLGSQHTVASLFLLKSLREVEFLGCLAIKTPLLFYLVIGETCLFVTRPQQVQVSNIIRFTGLLEVEIPDLSSLLQLLGALL